MIVTFKNLFLLITLFLLSNKGMTQQIAGEAIFIQKQIFEPSKKRSKVENNKKAERLRKLYEKEMSLVFTENESLYKEVPSLNAEENADYRAGYASAGGYVSNGVYKNLQNNTFTEQREFLGKLFLVNDTLPSIKWRSTKESKKIGEHLVIKATTTVAINLDTYSHNTEQEANFIVTAWFAPSIPVAHGPHFFQGLPGLILELHAKDTVFLCKSLIINKEALPSISPKSNGEEVSEEKFNVIRKAKKEERKN